MLPATQEAVHYNWLDDENRRVEHENFNLKEQLAFSQKREAMYKDSLECLIEASECREDEDCDHCLAVASIKEASEVV